MNNPKNMAAPRGQDSRGPNEPDLREAYRALLAQVNGETFRRKMADSVPKEFASVGYVDRLCTSILAAVRQNRKLLLADRATLINAAEEVAKKCLWVGDNVAWLVPYWNRESKRQEVQMQLGFVGAMIQVRRSGAPITIASAAVYEHDLCHIFDGPDARIEHEVCLKGDRGALLGAYAFGKHHEYDTTVVEWLPIGEYREIRDRSPGSGSPAHKNFPHEMARKTVLKRLCKALPLERAIDLTDMDDRAAQTIEGEASHVDTSGYGPFSADDADAPLAIEHSQEQPINTMPEMRADAAPKKEAVAAKGESRTDKENKTKSKAAADSDGRSGDAGSSGGGGGESFDFPD